MTKSIVFSAAAVAAFAVYGIAQQRPATVPGPFNAAQASAGRAAYEANCASCHLDSLVGRNEAPPLAGGNFMNTWGARSTHDLFAYIQAAMPPGNGGGLGAETYSQIMAYILEANGSRPGTQAFVPDTNVVIRTVATGQAPAPGRGGRGGAATGGPAPVAARPSGPHGLTVVGEVKNYTPVTDEMLTHPDPSDWLMIRRTYQAHSYSPLAKITNKNVQ